MIFDPNNLGYKGYKGNPLVKRSGVQIQWTQEMQDEWLKCAQDPIYFIKKYVKVIHVDHGLVPLELYDYQQEIIETTIKNRNTIICTSRQAGKTTAIVGFAVWYVLFNEDKALGILANKASTAREILNRIQLAYTYIPKWLQVGVIEWNKSSVSFENRCRILAEATSSSSVRGWSFSCIVIDEAAHVENWEDFFTSVYPTITSGKTTKLVLISTPNGLNHFWEFWSNAEKELNDFQRILVKWDKVPGRDKKWKEHTLATLNYNHEKFDQEYNCGWLGSSGTLIAGWRLKQLQHELPLIEKDDFKQYKHPFKNNSYILVADNAEGKGLDFSAFQIFDVTKMPYEQVAVYRCNTINAIDYSEVIYRAAKLYNNAAILVELNFLGEQIAHNIKWELEYDNLLHTTVRGRNGKQITFSGGKNVDKGIKTTSAVKSLGCSILKLLVEQSQITIYDKETIAELSTFSRKGVSYQAEAGKHDDLVMCLVLFAWLSDQQYFTELTDIKTMEKLKEHSSEELNDQMAIFGYITDGQSDMEKILDSYSTYRSIDEFMMSDNAEVLPNF